MYDIIFLEKIVCPHCRQELTEFEFQTKELSSLLKRYEFPDHVNKDDGKYELSGLCDICGSFIRGSLFIKNGVMRKISYTVENCPIYFIKAELEESLRSALIQNQILKESNGELLSALKALSLKVKDKEKIDEKGLLELEKIFSFSLKEEKKAVDKTAHVWNLVVGTRKYYIILSGK